MLSKLKKDWIKKENELMQKRPRRYLHFDTPIVGMDKKILDKVTNPNIIARYAFYPLIHFLQKNRIYKIDPKLGKKRVFVKPRPISYASHFDSLVYSWYAFLLEYEYEQRISDTNLNECVIAYRKLGKSNVDFAKEVFDFIGKKKDCVTLNFDIKGFYDSLDHSILKKVWKEILGQSDLAADHYNVYKSVTNFAHVRLGEFRKIFKSKENGFKYSGLFMGRDILTELREKSKIKKHSGVGIPQGTPISCVLSNIYMLSFDRKILDLVQKVGGMYRRYSDDIIVICPQSNYKDIESSVYEMIKDLKLEIQPSKTETRFFMENQGVIKCNNEKGRLSQLQYLGITFNGTDTLLRHRGYAKFERKMTRTIKVRLKKSIDNKKKLFKRKIYERFSPLGDMNYNTYAQNAATKLDSSLIQKQIKPQRIMKKINTKIRKFSAQL